MVPNPVRIAELAIDKQAQTLLMPVACPASARGLARRHVDADQHRVLQGLDDAVFKSLVE